MPSVQYEYRTKIMRNPTTQNEDFYPYLVVKMRYREGELEREEIIAKCMNIRDARIVLNSIDAIYYKETEE